MPETKAEEIARLQREIGQRQQRFQFLVLGDPRENLGDYLFQVPPNTSAKS